MTAHPAPVPYRLTIAAHATANLHGHTSAALRLPVTDSGTKPLSVALHVANVTKLARQYPGAGWARAISPRTMTLNPGQTRWFTLRVKVPPGVRGTHFLNFIAQARPVSSGQGTATTGVGGTLAMLRPGHVAALHVAGPHLVPHAAGGHGLMAVIGLALAGAVVALGLAAVYLRRQRGTRRAS